MLEELEPLFQRRTHRGLSNIHKYIAEKASNYHHDNATTMCNNNAPIYTRSFSARNSSSFKCEEVTANNQQHQNRKLTCNTGSNLHVRRRLNTSRAGTFSLSLCFSKPVAEELEPPFQRRTHKESSNIQRSIAEKASNYHHDNATTMCNNNAPIHTLGFSA